MPGPPPAVPVIALVASAGGLEALSRIVCDLPADLPACVVVCLHQAPDHISHLVDKHPRRAKVHHHIHLNGIHLHPN
jgi:two-component system chemotaxis response regulator CheB